METVSIVLMSCIPLMLVLLVIGGFRLHNMDRSLVALSKQLDADNELRYSEVTALRKTDTHITDTIVACQGAVSELNAEAARHSEALKRHAAKAEVQGKYISNILERERAMTDTIAASANAHTQLAATVANLVKNRYQP